MIPEPEDKLDAATAVSGPEDASLDWRQIDWRQVEENVRRLRQRIFTASRSGFLLRRRADDLEPFSFRIEGFHTVDLPGASGRDLPLIVPGATVHGAKDAAGNPFWFDGKVPSLGPNPALFAPSTATTYDGTARVDSGLPLGPPKPLDVQFTKPGVYKFFCDVHPGMVGFVVVKPSGATVPTAERKTRRRWSSRSPVTSRRR